MVKSILPPSAPSSTLIISSFYSCSYNARNKNKENLGHWLISKYVNNILFKERELATVCEHEKKTILLSALTMCRWFRFSFFPFSADPIDVLKVLELSENMEGVSLEAGLCTSRRGVEETDLAYKIDKKIQLSAPTKQLFPGSGLFFLLDHIQHSLQSHAAMKYLSISKNGKKHSDVSLLQGILFLVKP